MRLLLAESQLSEPVTLALAAISAGTKAAAFMKSPAGQAMLTQAAAIFGASPQNEQARYNGTLAEVRTNLGIASGMTLEKAVRTLEQIPALISDAQRKSAAGNTGEKRVMARYIKAFEQIANETMAWVQQAYPTTPGTPSLPVPPPVNITNPPPGAAPAFPGSPGAGQFFKNPVFLIGAGAILYLILKRK